MHRRLSAEQVENLQKDAATTKMPKGSRDSSFFQQGFIQAALKNVHFWPNVVSEQFFLFFYKVIALKLVMMYSAGDPCWNYASKTTHINPTHKHGTDNLTALLEPDQMVWTPVHTTWIHRSQKLWKAHGF